MFYIPAGRVHAICSGVLLAEVQQSSDVTYRIYDYNRVGLDGKPRELHTELAAQALSYQVEDEYRTEYSTEENRANRVVESPFFSVWVTELEKNDTIGVRPQLYYFCSSAILGIVWYRASDFRNKK